MELVDEPEGPVAQAPALRFTQLGHDLSQHPDRSGSREIETTQKVQEGALAGTGRPENRHALAG